MKRFVFMAMALLLVVTLGAQSVTMNEQDVQKRYEEAVNLLNTNIDGAKTFLEKWEKEDPGNPELYSLWFNYYYGKSMQSVIELAPQPAPGASGYAITDSTGRTVGYLQERTIFNDTLLSMAFNWLDRGIEANPNRLDFYLGKASASLEANKDSLCVDIVCRAIERAEIVGAKWLWTFGECMDKEPDFLEQCVQSYFLRLYEKANMDQVEMLLQAAASKYPKNIVFVTNKGLMALHKGDLHLALEKFLEAEKMDKKDHVVLMNIAYTYRELGDKDTARKYYSKVIKYCSPEIAAEAKMLMEKLDE